MKGYLKPWMSADTLRLAAAANMAFLFPHLYAKPPRPERPWEIERDERRRALIEMRPVAPAEPKITRQQARKLARANGRRTR